jgi:hypothetical protein
MYRVDKYIITQPRLWTKLCFHCHCRLLQSPQLIHSPTEHCGQAPSAPLCIRKVPGSNPGAAWADVGFFQKFPHTITSWYAGSVPTTFLPRPSSPYPSRIFPSVWLKRLWNASAAPPPLGGMKDVSFPFFFIHHNKLSSANLLECRFSYAHPSKY